MSTSPAHPRRMPITSQPSRNARMVTARMAGFKPGTSPPPVRIPITPFFVFTFPPYVLPDARSSRLKFRRFSHARRYGASYEKWSILNRRSTLSLSILWIRLVSCQTVVSTRMPHQGVGTALVPYVLSAQFTEYSAPGSLFLRLSRVTATHDSEASSDERA